MTLQPESELARLQTRRAFLGRGATGIGAAALGSLLASPTPAAAEQAAVTQAALHFAPKAKRVVYLFMSGGPSHIDLFDDKPLLRERDGQPMPEHYIKNHQFAMIHTELPLIKGSPYQFYRHGESGQQISRLLPHIGGVADDIAIIRSMHTDTFNHDPAVTFMNTGDVRFGRPSLGAWLSYGIGSECRDLPAFVVLASGVTTNQPLLETYWGSGFLPTQHQGVQFRSQGQPVLYVNSPKGIDRQTRSAQLDFIVQSNAARMADVGDPEILTRIRQYELAYRMQMSVPELTDLSTEPAHVHEQYGTKPGEVSYANNCLLARRLLERGVRFVQLYHKGWDSHYKLQHDHSRTAREVDQSTAALLKDLKQRGLLDDTLVVWGGEFGRTPMFQGEGSKYGRDHHPYGFSVWMAGGGIRGGVTHGATDDFGFHPAEDPVHVHDLNATILHCLGIDHRRLTFRKQGRDFRLTDVHGEVVKGVLS